MWTNNRLTTQPTLSQVWSLKIRSRTKQHLEDPKFVRQLGSEVVRHHGSGIVRKNKSEVAGHFFSEGLTFLGSVYHLQV